MTSKIIGDSLPAMSKGERLLRELVAFGYGGPHLYTDDGELSCAAYWPHIDFMRDTPEEIQSKIRQRNMKKLVDHTDWVEP